MDCAGGNGTLRSRLPLLLVSSSVAALLIGGGVPPAVAAPCNNVQSLPFDNGGGSTITNVCVHNGNFSGNLTNEGTISPNGVAIQNATITGSIQSTGSIGGGIAIDNLSSFSNASSTVQSAGNFSGGITNAGTLTVSAFNAAGISIQGGSTFSGGITNTGNISGGQEGIRVGFVTSSANILSVETFTGSISNSGTISAGFAGIAVAGASFVGAISNGGHITATGDGIYVATVPVFGSVGVGGITNSSTISAGSNGIIAVGFETFRGGITNAGTITAGNAGISAISVTTFIGDIVNSVAITANVIGINVQNMSAFSGGVTNSGSISAPTGIGIFASTINGAIVDTGTITAANFGIVVDNASQITTSATVIKVTGSTFAGGISNAGTIAGGNGGVLVSGVVTFGGGISNNGAINSTAGPGIRVDSVSTFSGNISNTGTIVGRTGIVIGNVGFTAGSAIINSGNITGTGGIAIDASGASTAITIDQTGGVISGAIKLSANADVLNISGGAINGNIVGSGANDTVNFALGSGTFTYANSFTGINQVNFNSGTVVLMGADTATNVAINGGTVVVGNSNAFGTAAVAMAAGTTLSFLDTGNFTLANNFKITGDPFFTPPAGTIQTLSGVIANGTAPGTLEMNGAGTLVLSATNTYSGPTNIDSGTLDVTGSIASSSLTNVNDGGALTGTGTVGKTQINSGGTLAPGNGTPGTALKIAGKLAFQSGAIYLVQVNPTTASFANVTGTASLAGTVQANFASGSYATKQYTILQSGGLGGTSFSGLSTTDLPASFTASVSYNADDAFLNLTAVMGHTLSTGGLNGNQQNVATSLNNFFNSGGKLPPGFLALFGLTGGALSTALSQLDGEAATDSERGAFQMMNQFFRLLLDPFVDGRSGSGWPGGGGGGGGASGFAPEQEASLPPDIALAYAGVLKAPAKAMAFDQRWSAWGAGFGGSSSINGDPAVGSSNVTATDYGFTAGMDYHYSPDTVAGFALAGGGTNWNLAQGLGSGRSDAFQAGVYGATRFGPAYLAAAFAFTNHWMTTDRFAFAGDQLTARFNAQSYGGRLEAGYRYAVLSSFGVTPYAALQAQSFHTPSYSETDLTAGGFGLSYNAMNATDTRSELGARFDDPTMLGAMPLLLRGRLAWAHDWVSNPALTPVFETLPGASFIVNGAPAPKNSALASAGALLHLTPALSFDAKFDGEFATGAQTYAGTGTLRYTW